MLATLCIRVETQRGVGDLRRLDRLPAFVLQAGDVFAERLSRADLGPGSHGAAVVPVGATEPGDQRFGTSSSKNTRAGSWGAGGELRRPATQLDGTLRLLRD